ncbi:MAG: 6-hydroxymethylpterin diphosphokinase MptE-like protein [Candidatus Nitrosocaldaceae archaeon]
MRLFVVMELSEWLRWYDMIRSEFGYSIVDDHNAAQVLSSMLKRSEIETLRRMIKNKDVVIFGSGPSLESFKDYHKFKDSIFIACDGACEALLANNIKPDVVVTDLDGDYESLIKASRLGAIMVVHAHSDNVKIMLNLVPKFDKCIATTQVKPFDSVYNFGGFTDGDRAVFLADALGASKIILVAMDLGDEIGIYSRSSVKKEVKIKKMKIAKRLLEYLAERSNSKLYNLSNSNIRGFENISIDDITTIK